MMRIHRRLSRRISRWPHLRCLAAALAISVGLASQATAQQLMVGADGAVHLDEMSEQIVNDPVVIEQAPELVGPGMSPMMGQGEIVGSAPMGAMLGYPATGYGGACPVPMVNCAPMVNIVTPKPMKHGIFGEFLFLHPTGGDIAHAQQQDGTGGAGTVPFGTIGVTDLHYEPGARVGGDWAMSNCTSIAATYTWFESNASSRVEAPVIPGGGGAVGSLVQHPGAALTASAGPVDARTVLDFQLADAEYRALLLNDKCFWLIGNVGLRWGHLEQEFGQTGIFSGSQGGNIVTQSDVDFDGGGPKFGIDGGRTIGKRGFSIYARAGVSPLAGQFRSRYSMTNTTTDITLARADWNDDRLMTLLDYEVGIAWSGPQRKWRFATGYTASYWYNAVTNSDYIGAVQTGHYGDLSDTISFDGLTARIERMW
jgi:hypothetical protein